MAHVMTVRGPVDPAGIGFALPHEHTQIALWHIAGRWDYWELTKDAPVIAAELVALREAASADAGGVVIADLTLDGVGRDPAWLVRLSEATGVGIVMGAGWYRGAYHPPEARIERRSVDELADEIERDLVVGVGSTGIRAGIIGEIGTDKPWVAPAEERVLRAAGRASRRTGAAVTTHAVMSDVGLAQLELLEAEGMDPARAVVGHADSYPHLGHYLEIVGRGASLEFDFLGMAFTAVEEHGEDRIVDLLLELLHRGHGDRILLSQDVCENRQLRRYGGRGYTYLLDTFLPRLRERGVSTAECIALTRTNPVRVLAIP